jgi:hypothetical protein
MPEVSRFLGILIYLYWRDHAPPHFHARYGKQEAVIDIRTSMVIAGSLPRQQLAVAIAWGVYRQGELMAAWDKAARGISPGRIAPLDAAKKNKKGKKK